jgi:hypothetical protein
VLAVWDGVLRFAAASQKAAGNTQLVRSEDGPMPGPRSMGPECAEHEHASVCLRAMRVLRPRGIECAHHAHGTVQAKHGVIMHMGR